MSKATLAAMVAINAVSGCIAGVETEAQMSTSDPLYQKVHAACGDDALIVKVVDFTDDEALCCVSYDIGIPSLHCMTASGATVVNPPNVSKLKADAKLAKP